MKQRSVTFGFASIFGVISTIIFVIIAERRSLSGHELLPHIRLMLYPNYRPSFTLGGLVIEVPNRYLAYPLKRGTVPDSTRCTLSKAYYQENESLCSHLSVQSSFSLEVPLRLRREGGEGENWLSSVAVIYGDSVRYPSHLLANLQSWRQGRDLIARRTPENDVSDYNAFVLMPRPGKDYGRLFVNRIYEIMVRSNEVEPRFADCTEYGSDQTMRGAVCIAAMGYLTETYPQNSDGRYPYLIRFSLPVWALSQSSEAGSEVSKFVSQFIVP